MTTLLGIRDDLSFVTLSKFHKSHIRQLFDWSLNFFLYSLFSYIKRMHVIPVRRADPARCK